MSYTLHITQLDAWTWHAVDPTGRPIVFFWDRGEPVMYVFDNEYNFREWVRFVSVRY